MWNKYQARVIWEQINSVVTNLRQISLLTYLREVWLRFTSEGILYLHFIYNEKWVNQINLNYYFT